MRSSSPPDSSSSLSPLSPITQRLADTSHFFLSFLGTLIAGYILTASGPESDPKSFIPAIIYAGTLSLLASLLVLAVRIKQSRELWKRV